MSSIVPAGGFSRVKEIETAIGLLIAEVNDFTSAAQHGGAPTADIEKMKALAGDLGAVKKKITEAKPQLTTLDAAVLNSNFN